MLSSDLDEDTFGRIAHARNQHPVPVCWDRMVTPQQSCSSCGVLVAAGTSLDAVENDIAHGCGITVTGSIAIASAPEAAEPKFDNLGQSS